MIISYAKNLYSKSPYNYTTPTLDHFEESQSDILIVSNSWDDYSSKTTCFVFTHQNENVKNLGEIKLAISGQTNTNKYFMEYFENLDYINITNHEINYYSLGQETDYYEKMKFVFSENAQIVLNILNDIAVSDILTKNPNILHDTNYHDSILRTSLSKTLIKKAEKLINDRKINFNFKIDYKLPTFTNRHELNFVFDNEYFENNDKKINNINLLIGENGVGKTQALLRIHNILQHFENNEDINHDFPLPFGNYIFITGSPFSKFKRHLTNKKQKKVNYTYIDLTTYHNYKNKLNEHLLEILKYDIKNCYLDRKFFKIYKLLDITKVALKQELKFEIYSDKTRLIIDELFTFETHLRDITNLFVNIKNVKMKILDNNNNEIKGLSSGQMSFLIQIFSILGNIKLNTLILIDEPELYLHPNLEITFMRFFRKILNEFNSYSVISTHSGIICREVPSSCIWTLKQNTNKEVVVDNPEFETLSYDLSDIYNYVYEGVLEKTYYEEWFSDIIKEDVGLDDSEFLDKYSSRYKSNILNKLLHLKNQNV